MTQSALGVLADLCRATEVHQQILRDIVIKQGALEADKQPYGARALPIGWWSDKLEELDSLEYIWRVSD